MEKIIEINNLNFRNLFRDFNISFPKQKFISISGPNNCGKTTLIKILSGDIFSDKCLKLNRTSLKKEDLDKYHKVVKSIVPQEMFFMYRNLEEEVLSYLNKDNKEEYNYLLKKLKLVKWKKTPFLELDLNVLIKMKLLLILINCPKVLLLDDIGIYFTKDEFLIIINCLKKYCKDKELTVIMTTSNLEEAIYSDYLYIIFNGKVFLEGLPLDVLQKDNVLNKIGLKLPFMVDLSVKLKDYNLIDGVELDFNRMVDELWK